MITHRINKAKSYALSTFDQILQNLILENERNQLGNTVRLSEALETGK